VIDESDLQHEKQSEQRISTLLGIHIDWSNDSKMVPIQFVSIVNLIQMRWMGLICDTKNNLNQEFQHCSE
jgi:hypothetical protein